MSIRRSIQDRERLVRRLEREFSQAVKDAESELSVRIGAELSSLRVDENGNIVASVGNVRITNRLNQVFAEFRRDRQRSIISRFIASLRKIFRLNSRYFAKVRRGGPHDKIVSTILSTLGYNVDSKTVKNGSWLDELTRFGVVRQSIFRRVTSSVLGALPIETLKKTISDLLKAGKGIFSQFFSRQTRDIFARVDRQTQNLYANELGLDFAFYSGTVKDNTRSFCRARALNVYTREEVESWQNQNWVGKIPGTDVKETCGGYNCRHHLSWVTQEVAENLGRINQYN
ncbi:MAG: hypothetical protein AAFO91_01390 [Bacteroidota bacterium]